MAARAQYYSVITLTDAGLARIKENKEEERSQCCVAALPASHTGMRVRALAPLLATQLPPTVPGKAADDDPTACAPATQEGDLDPASGSWLPPDSALSQFVGNEPNNGKALSLFLFLLFCLSNRYIFKNQAKMFTLMKLL